MITFFLVFLSPSFLNRAYYQRLMVLPSPFTACAAAYPSFINLDAEVASNAVTIRPHHCRTELVQNLECRLVTIQTELPLKRHCTHARCLARNKVRRPKPDRNWRECSLHNSASSKRHVTFATAASKHDGRTVRESERFAMPLTMLTDEAVGPPDLLQVRSTRRIIREKPHEVR